MRTSQMFPGLNNGQRIRFIISNENSEYQFGMYTTVAGISDVATTTHQTALRLTLEKLAAGRAEARRLGKTLPNGLAWRVEVPYGPTLKRINVDVQVDLV